MQRIPPLRKAMSYVQQARAPLPDRLEAYNFLEREVLADVFEPDFLAAVDPKQPRAIARDVYARTTSTSPVNRMMHLDLKKILADNDLRKVNVTCEMAGIEVRYPLLDDELVAFSGHLSPSHKVNRLQLRHFFKDALKDFLPPETLVKTKHGFGLPFGLWLEKRRDTARDRERQPDGVSASRVRQARLRRPAAASPPIQSRQLFRRDDLDHHHARALAAWPRTVIGREFDSISGHHPTTSSGIGKRDISRNRWAICCSQTFSADRVTTSHGIAA